MVSKWIYRKTHQKAASINVWRVASLSQNRFSFPDFDWMVVLKKLRFVGQIVILVLMAWVVFNSYTLSQEITSKANFGYGSAFFTVILFFVVLVFFVWEILNKEQLEIVTQLVAILTISLMFLQIGQTQDSLKENHLALLEVQKQNAKSAYFETFYRGYPIDVNKNVWPEFWVFNSGYRTVLIGEETQFRLLCDSEIVDYFASAKLGRTLKDGQERIFENLSDRRILQPGDYGEFSVEDPIFIEPKQIIGKKYCYIEATVRNWFNNDINASIKIDVNLLNWRVLDG